MVVSFERNGTEYLVDVLAMVADQPVDMKNNNPTRGKRFQIKPIVPTSTAGEESSSASSSSLNNGEPRVVQVPLSQVDRLSSVRVYSPKDMRPIEGRVRVQKSIAEVMKRFPDGIPLLNPEEDMKVEGSNFRKLVRRIEALEGMLAKHPLVGSEKLPAQLEAFAKKRGLALACKVAKREAKAASGLILRDELKHRRRVLRRMNHVSEEAGRRLFTPHTHTKKVEPQLVMSRILSPPNSRPYIEARM